MLNTIKATNKIFEVTFKMVLGNGSIPPQEAKIRRVFADNEDEAKDVVNSKFRIALSAKQVS